MKDNETIVEILPNGDCSSLWEDGNLFSELGNLKVTRLADVDFDNKRRGWVVAFRNGVTLPVSYQNRIDALMAEMEYVESHLSQLTEWARNQQESF